MTYRIGRLLLMSGAVAVVVSTMWPKPVPRLVWNASASVPVGLYGVRPDETVTVADLVVAMPPEPLASVLADHGYLPRGIPLIKHVLARSGQTVCRDGLLITIDGIGMGLAYERDSHSRPLPSWEGCHVIMSDEVFLMNRDEPASLDGRYFGAMPVRSILGRAVPIWTS